MLEVRPLALASVKEIRPKRHTDARGFFVETYSDRAFAEAGLPTAWVQDNHSLSRSAGTVRGLHFQRSPIAQAKLVRVVRGRIFDVAVDLATGAWAAVELSADEGNQLYIPEGFAHGFITLEPDCEVFYKVSAPYSAAHEATVRWDDPAIGIDWPTVAEPVLSDRDAVAPPLAQVDTGR